MGTIADWFKRITNQSANETSTMMVRDRLANALGQSHGGERDIYEVYGYPEQPSFNIMYQYASRQGMAHRIVRGVPKSCWSDGFKMYADDTLKTEILEDELAAICAADFTSVAMRADALNRIGRFSAIFVGVPDGLDPREPIGSVRGKALDVIYFRPFAYDGIEPHKYDNDPMSPRFGQPEEYQMQVMGRGDNEKDHARMPIIAHWTRVIHIVEEPFDSDIEGVPALQPVFNRILDLDKVLGGSAEAYFRNARGKIGFEVDSDFGTELLCDADAKASFDRAARSFTNNQQDQIVSVGSKIVPISTAHQSPIDTVKALMWEVSGYTRIPIRYLTGEGSGQLAGSEDKLAYNSLIADRQLTFCNKIAERMLEILGECGAITVPDEYHIEWNIQDSTSEAEKAGIMAQKSAALAGILNATAASGEGVDLESALTEVGFEEIEVVEVEIPEMDDGFGGESEGDESEGSDDGEEAEEDSDSASDDSES